MSHTLIKNALIINRGKRQYADLHIKDSRIEKIAPSITLHYRYEEMNGENMWLLPGIIDDQVHFREPGLTHKADIASESKAAIAGGVTTFMEMPNTQPPALTQSLLQDKYDIAARTAYSNYSFFMGASNENYDEVMRTNPEDVCGIKIFMGSSTGNMLVDNTSVLERLFANIPMLIATHCEDEATIRNNMEWYKATYGDAITPDMHPLIRSEEGCYKSSSLAVELARKYNTRLHVLHISTAKELELFGNSIPLSDKRITAEVCVHHLYFSADDYDTLGNQIKCNPAIKAAGNKEALFNALMDNRLDIIATDHAPHTWDEKSKPYLQAPSGLPLVQHSLNIMLDFERQGKITLEKIAEKMSHAPAQCFGIQDRGYLDEGMFADIVLIDPTQKYTIDKSNLLYKCGWSPLEGKTFEGKVSATFVNGYKVYDALLNTFVQGKGQRLFFNHTKK